MLPCKEVIKIISTDDPTSLLRRTETKLHLMMCKHCARYANHLKMVKSGFKKLFAIITAAKPTDVATLEKETIEKFATSGTSQGPAGGSRDPSDA